MKRKFFILLSSGTIGLGILGGVLFFLIGDNSATALTSSNVCGQSFTSGGKTLSANDWCTNCPDGPYDFCVMGRHYRFSCKSGGFLGTSCDCDTASGGYEICSGGCANWNCSAGNGCFGGSCNTSGTQTKTCAQLGEWCQSGYTCGLNDYTSQVTDPADKNSHQNQICCSKGYCQAPQSNNGKCKAYCQSKGFAGGKCNIGASFPDSGACDSPSNGEWAFCSASQWREWQNGGVWGTGCILPLNCFCAKCISNDVRCWGQDSDGGENLNTYGECTHGGSVKCKDSCGSDGTSVNECYAENSSGFCRSVNRSCSPGSCQGGKCITGSTPPPQKKCSDLNGEWCQQGLYCDSTYDYTSKVTDTNDKNSHQNQICCSKGSCKQPTSSSEKCKVYCQSKGYAGGLCYTTNVPQNACDSPFDAQWASCLDSKLRVWAEVGTSGTGCLWPGSCWCAKCKDDLTCAKPDILSISVSAASVSAGQVVPVSWSAYQVSKFCLQIFQETNPGVMIDAGNMTCGITANNYNLPTAPTLKSGKYLVRVCDDTGIKCGSIIKFSNTFSISSSTPPTTCNNNGKKEGDEKCDGSDFGGKTCKDFGSEKAEGLKCNTNCTIDTSGCETVTPPTNCNNNGKKEGDEKCDGSDFGGKTCKDFGSEKSEGLTCNTNCTINTSGCETVQPPPETSCPSLSGLAASGITISGFAWDTTTGNCQFVWNGKIIPGFPSMASHIAIPYEWMVAAGFPSKLTPADDVRGILDKWYQLSFINNRLRYRVKYGADNPHLEEILSALSSSGCSVCEGGSICSLIKKLIEEEPLKALDLKLVMHSYNELRLHRTMVECVLSGRCPPHTYGAWGYMLLGKCPLWQPDNCYWPE